MSKRLRQLLASLFALILISAFYFFWGHLIDGPFPHRTAGIKHFEEHEAALNAYVQRLRSDEIVGKVICYDIHARFLPSEFSTSRLNEEELAEYHELCREARVLTTWNVEDGYLHYLGAASRDQRDFHIAFIWRESGRREVPDCADVAELRDFGKCVVPLGEGWVLDYEWSPVDYESAEEKQLMELAEDVADELASQRPTS